MVTQIFLDRFDAVTTFQSHHCICMPKVMEPCLRAADFCCDPFEAVIYSPVGEPISNLIGEDEMAVHPAGADKESLPGLLLAVKLQEFHHRWGNGYPP